MSFCRYLPASAFIPLLILWAGIGETQKLLVIFIGSVFQVIADGGGHRGRRAHATWSRPPTRWAPTAAASSSAC